MTLNCSMKEKFTRFYKNLCHNLGKNNDPLYGVLTIAASKGILRPTFTMMDKKQDKKSRKYTAFREGLTGLVAFGAYIATHKGVDKLVKPFCKKANIVGKECDVEKTMSLIAVSLSALFVIPFVCNKITSPLLKFAESKHHRQPAVKPPYSPNFSGKNPVYKTDYISVNRNVFADYGMRIGG